MATISREDRVAGGIWGLLVGDAVGVPYEFQPADLLPESAQIDLVPPADFERSHRDVPVGTWSDDGAHALCLLAGLLWNQRLDPEDLMRRMTNWYELGYMTADGQVFDVGVQTSNALAAFRDGTPALDCGPSGEMDNGNGSLMRVLPLALWHQGTDEELVQLAHLQSRPTHGHPRAQVCCALYCLMARHLLDQRNGDAWRSAVAQLRTIYPEGSELSEQLEFHIRPDQESDPGGSGYVVDCLRSAVFALNQPDFEGVIRAAISLGRDTDTTAAVAGGLAGIRQGVQGIPSRWLDGLRSKETVTPMIDELIEVLREGG